MDTYERHFVVYCVAMPARRRRDALIYLAGMNRSVAMEAGRHLLVYRAILLFIALL